MCTFYHEEPHSTPVGGGKVQFKYSCHPHEEQFESTGL